MFIAMANGGKEAYLEMLDLISGSERVRLGSTLRRAIHEALEEAAKGAACLWRE